MKKSLYLYLFILSVLINVFTYAYFTKKGGFEQGQQDASVKQLQDTIALQKSKLADADYFSLEHNQNAQNYLANSAKPGKFIPYEKLIPILEDRLKDFNENPKGNPYTGQDQLGAQKFIINKVKVINHRWIIADYSDGEYWGEALIKYFLNDDDTIQFELMQSFLYPKVTN